MRATRAGRVGGDLAVEVAFDPTITSFEALATRARRRGCATGAFTLDDAQTAVAARLFARRARPLTGEFQPTEDPKHYLQRTPMRFVPLTALQALRMNSAVNRAKNLLSPRQVELLKRFRNERRADRESLLGHEIIQAWREVTGSGERKPGD